MIIKHFGIFKHITIVDVNGIRVLFQEYVNGDADVVSWTFWDGKT